MDTNYSIRIKAQNKLQQTSDYSQIIKIKTKDQNWISKNIPKIPSFNYQIKNINNQSIRIFFKQNEMDKINKITKYKERYLIEIAFTQNQQIHHEEKQINWKEVTTLNANKLIYVYNDDDQIFVTAKYVHIRIMSNNDLDYHQYSKPMDFEMNKILWKAVFDQKHCGDDVKFISDTSITKKNKIDGTCLFGQVVSSDMCNKYNIHIKAKSYPIFTLGYVSSMDCIKNWNQQLGQKDNYSDSIGLWCNSTYFNFFGIGEYKNGTHLGQIYRAKQKFKIGDIFIMSFDFTNDCFQIHHNGCKAIEISLKGYKSVIAAVSLTSYMENESLEVIKWEFI